MGKRHNPGFLALVEAARARVEECSIDELAALCAGADAPTLVDVREESEYAAGRIPGAVHLGKGILERDVETRFPARDHDLVLYCGGGYRSALAAESLLKLGYTRVRSVWGGIRGWREAGHPVES